MAGALSKESFLASRYSNSGNQENDIEWFVLVKQIQINLLCFFNIVPLKHVFLFIQGLNNS